MFSHDPLEEFMNIQRFALSLTLGFAIVLVAGCGSRRTAPYAAPHALDNSLAPRGGGVSTQPPGIVFEVEPASIMRGEKALLRWTTQDATEVRVSPAIGLVDPNGSREVAPTQDTVYSLTAKGAGGVSTATARLSIVGGGLPSNRGAVTSEDIMPPFPEMVGQIRDIYFDYDAAGLRPEMEQVLIENGRLLMDLFAQYPDGTVLIEGHCDERGTNEYNLALGDRRAQSVKDFLAAQGVPASRMRTVSFGEEQPQCYEAAESCWSRNRRAHFKPMQ